MSQLQSEQNVELFLLITCVFIYSSLSKMSSFNENFWQNHCLHITTLKCKAAYGVSNMEIRQLCFRVLYDSVTPFITSDMYFLHFDLQIAFLTEMYFMICIYVFVYLDTGNDIWELYSNVYFFDKVHLRSIWCVQTNKETNKKSVIYILSGSNLNLWHLLVLFSPD